MASDRTQQFNNGYEAMKGDQEEYDELIRAPLKAEIERLRGLIEGLRHVRLNPADADMPAAKALYAELNNYQQNASDK